MPKEPILIVDDDCDVRQLVGELLEEEGYAVEGVPNGEAALELIRGGVRPALILLDLMMPGMDGWGFRHEQLRDPALRQIPVVIASASGYSRESIDTELAPAEFLPKPYQAENLLAVVRSLTEGPRLPG
jgi:CheY-like chemotaxis protein